MVAALVRNKKETGVCRLSFFFARWIDLSVVGRPFHLCRSWTRFWERMVAACISDAPGLVSAPGAVVARRAFFLDSRAAVAGAAESAVAFVRWHFAAAPFAAGGSVVARLFGVPSPAACEDSRFVVAASARSAD